MTPADIRLGDTLTHKDQGEIVVLGIAPHCGDYAINYMDNRNIMSWCYLKNCK